jgi:hypothetical protein
MNQERINKKVTIIDQSQTKQLLAMLKMTFENNEPKTENSK